MTESGITFGVMCAADMMSSAGIQQFAKQAEAAGLDQIWIPELLGRDPFLTAALILRVTDQIRVGTAIANVYVRDARATKSAAYSLVDAFGDRFDLGLGVSNPVGNVPGDMRGYPRLRNFRILLIDMTQPSCIFKRLRF